MKLFGRKRLRYGRDGSSGGADSSSLKGNEWDAVLA